MGVFWVTDNDLPDFANIFFKMVTPAPAGDDEWDMLHWSSRASARLVQLPTKFDD